MPSTVAMPSSGGQTYAGFNCRFFSSDRCIVFQGAAGNDIPREVRKTSLSQLRSGASSFKWVNLLLNNVPQDLLDEGIHLFYRFFRDLVESAIGIVVPAVTDIVKERMTQFIEGVIGARNPGIKSPANRDESK
jgi:hypothetical protein